MNYSRKLLGPMVSSAVALIVVTNYCLIRILARPESTTAELLNAIWPMALPASIAVILVMSTLYHTLQEVLAQLDGQKSELLERAKRDSLTGVATREHFEAQLEQALSRFQRSGDPFSVIILDLDHFKRVNDIHGHQAGDEVLKQVAIRLLSEVRSCDTVARFGGDEFLVLQVSPSRPDHVRQLCGRLSEALREPYEVNSKSLRLPASMGAVVGSKDLHTATDYIRAADVALYEAKTSGRNCYRFFSEDLDERLRRRDTLESDLRSALETGVGVSICFQPQVSAVDGSFIGVESLFRWAHAEYGEIPAIEAISIAEESNLVELLGEFVFRNAAIVARKFPQISVAINVSPAQFSQTERLAQRLRALARDERVQPEQIELEITEQLLMDVGSGCDTEIAKLRDYGFRVALDDFGTGYSSLSYLRRFKVDRLKLDKSFAVGNIREDVAVIRATVGLAHLLGLEVVAEGIETELQEAVALESGCDVLQGYRYSAPLSPCELEAFVEQRLTAAA